MGQTTTARHAEDIDKALQGIVMAREDLEHAHRIADPVAAIVLLDLIRNASDLENRVARFRLALRQQQEARS